MKVVENLVSKPDVELLWMNPDGINVNLNDPVAFQQELDKEKLRYRLYLQNRFLTDEIIYKNVPPSQKACYTILMQRIKDRANRKGTSFATELKLTIYKHMEAYKAKLKKEKEKLSAEVVTYKEIDNIWWHRTTAYDMSTEEGAKAYINRMAINHLGGQTTPDRIKAKLELLRQDTISKLKAIGYTVIAEKLDTYINELMFSLKQGTIPKELQNIRKRPALVKQVRNKNYDISDKYAFGTYLSFSYRDILKQNPELSEAEARKILCSTLITEFQNNTANPTALTALKQLEKAIDSPTEFYNLIHARRLANLKSAEKRKQHRQNKSTI